MVPGLPTRLVVLLLITGCATVHGQSANYSPSPSIVERIKEQTLSDHGVNVTEHVPSATNASEAVQNLTGIPVTAPSLAPSHTPLLAPEPSTPALAPGPHLATNAAAPAPANSSASHPAANDTFADGQDPTPALTPSAITPVANASASDILQNTTGLNATEIAAAAKDAIKSAGASVSSGSYGSVVAGTLVAAVVIVGLAGTVVVWRRRRGNSYQGLHDTEMAMIRREH